MLDGDLLFPPINQRGQILLSQLNNKDSRCKYAHVSDQLIQKLVYLYSKNIT